MCNYSSTSQRRSNLTKAYFNGAISTLEYNILVKPVAVLIYLKQKLQENKEK